MTLAGMCRMCRVCSFAPEGGKTYSQAYGEHTPQVLVIDDADVENMEKEKVVSILQKVIPVSFTYTLSIRCNEAKTVTLDDRKVTEGLNKCSVWTRSLVQTHSVILATPNALRQMGLHGEVGEVLAPSHIGTVLVIMPIAYCDREDLKSMRTRLKRILANE